MFGLIFPRWMWFNRVILGSAPLFLIFNCESQSWCITTRVTKTILTITYHLLSIIRPKWELGVHGMITAVINLCPNKFMITVCALVFLQSCIYLHEYISPRYSLLSEEHHELVYIPLFIRYVLSNYSTVGIDKDLGFWAHHPLPLFRSVQLITVDTSMQHILLIFE